MKTEGTIVSALGRTSILCLLLFSWPVPLVSSVITPSKIVCREELSISKREDLAAKLRVITGWPELKFDEDGRLRFESRVTNQGSQTARDLLERAQAGRKVIIIEDASDRQDVVFCRVVPALWKNHQSNMPPAFVVLIDFADFDHVIGDRSALKSFNLGWGFLHEIDHVIDDSEDAADLGEAGECEDHLNQMRRELGLPVRANYFFTYFPETEKSNFKPRYVRLAFDQTDAETAKPHRYWIIWDATVVGGIDQRQVTARR